MSPPEGTNALLACQWAGVSLVFVAAWVVGVQGWGLWMPVAGFVIGTACWVWRLAPDPAMTDREGLRALALAAGWRGGAVVGLLAVWGLPGAEEGGPEGLVMRSVLALLLMGVSTVTLVALTLVGLDGGRTRALAAGTEGRR